MAKDPAFLFYPGDYLRDTQTLSEKTQVSYDRIMCEHMRNICISERQLKFFTKRLSEDEIDELKFVLTKVNGGYQIEWVAESIVKRKEYSNSRRKNRIKKSNNISKSYDKHMENENENKEEVKDKRFSKLLNDYVFCDYQKSALEKWTDLLEDEKEIILVHAKEFRLELEKLDKTQFQVELNKYIDEKMFNIPVDKLIKKYKNVKDSGRYIKDDITDFKFEK